MPSIDERVVQLQFDNEQFESGVKTSMNSLNRFDSQLNQFDISRISGNLEALQRKFSVFGIAGVTAVSRITNALMDFGKKKWNDSFGQIITGGISRAQNIADSKFMLKGLGMEWDKQLSNITLTEQHMTEEEKKLGKVTDSISDDIDYGVKDTAYGLDAAAKAAAQLMASSVEVGDSMRTALRGISGVAAMTNSSYEDISNIFTNVAGSGKLMTMQLRQLEWRGMNAAATLAEQLGKSEAQIREMVTKGKIDFEMFAKAMDDAFGEHAKDANQTFQGASSNLRAAFSRVGADFYSVYMDKMIPVLNGVKTIVDDIRKFTKPVSETFEDLFGYFTGDIVSRLEKIHEYLFALREGKYIDGVPLENFKNTLESISEIIKNIYQPIKDAFSEVFPKQSVDAASAFSKQLSDIFAKIANFTRTDESIFNNDKTDFYKGIKGTFETLLSVFRIFAQIVGVVASGVFDLASFLGKIINPAGGAAESLGEWVKSLADSGVVGEIAAKVVSRIVQALKIFSAIAAVAIVYAFKFAQGIGSIIEKLSKLGFFEVLFSGFMIFGQILSAVGKGILDIVNYISQLINPSKEASDSIKEFAVGLAESGKVGEVATKVVDTIVGALKVLIGIVGTATGKIGSFVGSIIPDFSALGIIIDKTSNTYSKLNNNVSKGVDTSKISSLSDIFSNIASKLTKIKDELWPRLEPIFKQVGINIKKSIEEWGNMPLGQRISNLLKVGIGAGIANITMQIGKLIGTAGKLIGTGEKFENSILSMFNGFRQNGIESLFPTLTKNINGLLQSVSAKTRVQALHEFGKAILEIAGALFILSLIPVDKLAEATVVIGALMFGLTQMLKQINSMENLAGSSATDDSGKGIFGKLTGFFDQFKSSAGTIAAVGGTILALSFALINISAAIAIMTKLYSGNKEAAIFGTISIIALIFILLEEMNHLDIKSGKQAIAVAVTAHILSGAILAMTGAIAIMSKLISGNPGGTLVALVAVMLMFAGVVATMKLLSDSSEETVKKGFAILEIAGSLITIAKSIKMLSSILNDNSSGGLIAFGMIMIAFAALIGAIYALTKIDEDPDEIKGYADVMIKMCTSLVIIAGAIKLLSDAVSNNQTSSIIAFAGIMIAMGAIVAALNLINPEKAEVNASSMIKLALTLVAIAGVVSLLGNMKLGSIIQGLIGLTIILTLIAVFAGVVGATGVVALGLEVIAACIVELGIAMLAAGAGIALFGAGLMFIAAGVTALAAAWAASGPMIINGITGVLSAIAAMIPTIATALANGLLNFVEVVSSHFPVFVDLGMKILKSIVEGFIQTSDEIATMTITILAKILNALADNIDSIATSLNTIIIALMEKIDWPRILSTFTSGFGELIGTSIGSVAGGAVGAMMQGVIDAIAQVDYTSLAKHLNGFIKELTPFIEGSKLIDPSCMEGIKNLAEAVIVLTAADFLDGISRFLGFGGTSLKRMGEQLNEFAPSLVQFADATSTINGLKLAEVSLAMTALFRAASEAPDEGGLISKLAGDNTLDTFAESLPKFGKALAGFGSWAEITDTASINAISPVMVTLFKALMEAPNKGGLISKLTGDNDISQFIDTLPLFGKAVSGFGAWAAITDSNSISAICPVLTNLFSTLSTVPTQGGLIENIIGGNGIDKFGPSLEQFGIALYKFGYYLSQTNLDGVSTAITNLQGLIDIFNNLKEFDGSSSIDKLLDSVVKGFNVSKIQNNIKSAATDFVSGFATGILEKKYLAINAATTLGNDSVEALRTAIDAHSDSKLTIAAGHDYGNGLVTGMEDTLPKIKETGSETGFAALTSLYDGAKSALNEELPDGILGLAGDIFGNTDGLETEAEAAGIRVGNKFYKGVSGNIWATERLINEYNTLWDEYSKFSSSSRWNQEDETKYIDQLKTKFSEVAPYLKGVNKETEQYRKEYLDGKSKATEEAEKLNNKANNNLSEAAGKAGKTQSKFVLDNSEFWKTLYAQNQSGIYGAHNQLEKFADWEESTVKKVESIVKDFKENGLSNAIKEANSGLFSKVSEEKKEVSKEELKKNLQDQIAQIQDYNRTMAQLEYRITDVNLRDAISEMGMDSISELKALNSMTDQELTEYTSLYNQKVLASFNGIKDKASMQVSELLGGAPMDITALATSWDGTAKQLGEMASQAIQTHFSEALKNGLKLDEATLNGMQIGQLAPQLQQQLLTEATKAFGEETATKMLGMAKPLGTNTVDGVIQGVTEKQTELNTVVETTLQNAIDAGGKKIGDDVKPNDPAKQGIIVGDNLMLGVEEGVKQHEEPFTAMITAFMDGLLELLKGYQDDFEVLGENLGDGLAKGIKAAIAECKRAIDDLVGNGIIEPYTEETETESPSKLFTRYGGYLVQGLANGIIHSIGTAVNATSTLADAVSNPMYDVIQSIGDAASGQLDFNPVITPILDLSSLGSSVNQMNSMLSDRKVAIKNASLEADMKFSDQMAKAFKMADSRPNNITNNVTIDGAEDPNAWAQSFVNTMRREMRASYG